MTEKILFYGGLNSDDEDRFLADGDYRYALNIRNSKTDKASIGAIENSRGNTEITFTLPTGLNECIGSKYDGVNNRIIFFIWNSLSSHSIYELNIGTQVVTLLLQSSVFNFDRNYPILHCEIINDLCYWTDEFNPERKINIARAKSGGYTTIDEQVISRIQYAPNYSPITAYGNDAAVTTNKVRGKMFQFKYAYVYEDNEISAFSPVSKIAIPPNQALYDFGGYYETTLDNYIAVEVNTGNYLCKRIQIVVRESNTTDWYLAKEIESSEWSSNPTFTYNFYNNEVFIPVTQASVNRLFDNVPLLTGAISLIDGNRLTSSDITEGFDNIDISANSAVAVYNEYPPIITSRFGEIDIFGNPSYNTIETIFSSSTTNPTDFYQNILIDANTINPTDVWNLFLKVGTNDASVTPNINLASFSDSFVASFLATDTSVTIANYFANLINNSSELNRTITLNVSPFTQAAIVTTATVSNYGAGIERINIHYHVVLGSTSGVTTYMTAYTRGDITSNIVTKTFKHNAKHSFALVYYDNPNRSGVCQVTNNFNVDILPYSNLLKTGSVEMDININNTPPSWATHYQILYTGNRSVSSYLQMETGVWANVGNMYKIYIVTIANYNTDSGGRANLSYSWAKGDRVTFIKDGVTNNFFTTFYDFEIVSSSSDGGGQYIMVQNVSDFVWNGNKVVIEMYTPKLAQEQIFYWEIGEVFPITNGLHIGTTQNQTSSQPAIVRVNSGDSYFRYRGYATDSFIEDYSLSDFYTSNSWDKGRFNVVDKEYKRINRYATTYYSEQFVPDTNINGLSTIYDTNFHEANKSYGSIQKTYAEQDRIYLFQQLRTGFSLVNKDVLYNSDGTPNGVVGQANQVLSDVNYYIQDYGIGNNPESFAVDGTRKYHVDPNKGYVLRLSIDGYTEISDYKYRNFFQDLFNRRKEIAPAFLGKIWGGFDRRFGEYVLAFAICKTADSIVYNRQGAAIVTGDTLIDADTVSFSEEKKRWVTHYSWKPEFIQLNGIDLVTWTGGKMYLHNSSDTYNNFYGVQYDSQMETVANENPSNIKFFNNIYQETSAAWSCVLTNQFGQESSLEVTDFELNEGVYYAALLKDINTPNVSSPLIEGDDMRCFAMTISMTNTNTDFVKLFAINIGYGFSEFTNK